jgi:hypothetical protein
MSYGYQDHVPSRAEIVIGMIADAYRRFRDRQEFVRFANECPDEVDRLSRDLNIDTGSLLRIAGAPKDLILLDLRMSLLGIDAAKLAAKEPATMQDLARCCALCDSKSKCAHDLAGKPGKSDWHHYCPNESTLSSLGPDYAKADAAL